MKEIAFLRQLASKARGETAPAIHVSGRVLDELVLRRRLLPSTDRSVAVSAGISLLAAAVLALVAVRSWTVIESPAVELFSSLQWVLQ